MKRIFYGLFCLPFIIISCDKNKDTTREAFIGEDITKNSVIEIDKKTKEAYLKIDTKGEWTLYNGKSTDSIDFSKPLLSGTGSGSFKLTTPENQRAYYFLKTQEGTAFLAESQLPMEGGFNFRDLGGIRNKDGKYIQWGKIFRSDELHNLTARDLTYLASIPVVSVVDFRSEEEMQTAPDKLPSSVKKYYAYSIVPGNLNIDIKSLNHLQPTQLDTMMMQMNISFVTDSVYYGRYKEFFSLLMDENKIPLMYHCTAGKDRTGMATALILYALNVDEPVIMENYLLSNLYLEDKYKDIKAEHPVLKSLFDVKPEFLQAGIDQMKKDHGSVENFLRDVLDVDIEKFREMYLYK